MHGTGGSRYGQAGLTLEDWSPADENMWPGCCHSAWARVASTLAGLENRGVFPGVQTHFIAASESRLALTVSMESFLKGNDKSYFGDCQVDLYWKKAPRSPKVTKVHQ